MLKAQVISENHLQRFRFVASLRKEKLQTLTHELLQNSTTGLNSSFIPQLSQQNKHGKVELAGQSLTAQSCSNGQIKYPSSISACVLFLSC